MRAGLESLAKLCVLVTGLLHAAWGGVERGGGGRSRRRGRRLDLAFLELLLVLLLLGCGGGGVLSLRAIVMGMVGGRGLCDGEGAVGEIGGLGRGCGWCLRGGASRGICI